MLGQVSYFTHLNELRPWLGMMFRILTMIPGLGRRAMGRMVCLENDGRAHVSMVKFVLEKKQLTKMWLKQ